MRFLLDTNAIISLLGRKSESLVDRNRVLNWPEGDIGISAIVSHELYFGAYRSWKVSFNLETIRLRLRDFVTLPF